MNVSEPDDPRNLQMSRFTNGNGNEESKVWDEKQKVKWFLNVITPFIIPESIQYVLKK